MDSKRRTILVSLAIAVTCMVYFGTFVGYGINLEDEGTVVSQMARFADGQDLYTDFHIGYTPGVYWVHGLLLKAFDGNLIPGRWVLAVVTTTAAVLLFLLAFELSGHLWLSMLAPFLYIASIPVHPGAFAAFNIPYPVWYAVPLSTAGVLALLRFGRSGSYAWLAAGGLIAGITFSFKPNTGLFHLAVASMVALTVIPLQHRGEAQWAKRGKTLLWWLWWAAVLGGLALVFSGSVNLREPLILVTPFIIGAVLVAWRAAVVPPTEPKPTVVRSASVLGASFLLPTSIWLLYYHHRLGTQLFLERVLYFRAEIETFYYVGLPPVVPAALVGLGAVLIAAVLPKWLARASIRPAYILLGTGLLALGGLVLLVIVRPMPEGFYKAVMSQYEVRVFAATAAVHWILLWLFARSIGTTTTHRGPSLNMAVLSLAAIGLYLPIYPRSDYMHWVTAGPLSIVAGTVLLAFLAERWAELSSPNLRRAAYLTLAAPLLVLGLMRLGHYLGAVATFESGVPQRLETYKMDNRRAPIWMTLGRAGEYRDIADVSRFIEKNTEPDEEVFTFPSLDFLSFMSGRPNPTRHGYFYPGWPGRQVESEVVADLIKANPRFAVVLHGHPMFFTRAPAYFYQFDRLLETRYRPYARFGKYMVLANKRRVPSGSGPWRDKTSLIGAVSSEWLEQVSSTLRSEDSERRLAQVRQLKRLHLRAEIPALTAALNDPEQEIRDEAALAYSSVKDPEVVRKMLDMIPRGAFSRHVTMSVLRNAHGDIGMSAALPVLSMLNSNDMFIALNANDLLYTLSNREFYAAFWFGKKDDSIPRVVLDPVTEMHVKHWLTDPYASMARRYFAILQSPGEGPDQCPAALHKLVAGESSMQLRVLAMWEAAKRNCGYDEEVLKYAVNYLMYDDTLSPRIALRILDRHEDADVKLASAIRNATDQKKMNLLWIASQAGGKETANELLRTLGDPEPAVRVASVWALANIGTMAHASHLMLALADDDANVVEMAERGLFVLRDRHGDGG